MECLTGLNIIPENMSEKLQIKVGQTLVANATKMDMYGKQKVLEVTKVVRKYDPRKHEGYDQIHCGKEVYDSRDGHCIAGDDHYCLQFNQN